MMTSTIRSALIPASLLAQCRSSTPTLVCRKVSAACRAELAPVSFRSPSCQAVSTACQQALCPAPYQCVYTRPCGNETDQERVWCYGP